ncbi:MAG: NAD(P)-dependent oxidoreductase [Bacteroidia bacterium]
MKLLVIDPFPAHFVTKLKALPLELVYLPEADRPEVHDAILDAHILLLNSKVNVNISLLDAAPQLKLIIRAGVGMDHIDVQAAAALGIRAVNCAGANADAVGELTLAMMLGLRRNLLRADAQVRDFIWKREDNRGLELSGATIGLIGYGHTGKAVARRLQGFGCKVLAYDKYLVDYGDEHAEAASMDTIFAEADVLSLHIPLNPETKHLVDASFINQFHKSIYLFNLARGPIVKLQDIPDLLDFDKVLGIGLDVLPNEKMDNLSDAEYTVYRDIFHRPNVILTPHIGGWTDVSLDNIQQMILDYLNDMIAHADS